VCSVPEQDLFAKALFDGADHHKAIILSWNAIDYIATKNT